MGLLTGWRYRPRCAAPLDGVVSGEPAPVDDVAELHWFSPDALPGERECACRWVRPCLRAWASKS